MLPDSDHFCFWLYKTVRNSIYFAIFYFVCYSTFAQTIPPDAVAVIHQVRAAAKMKNFSALEKLMVPEFLWSFGGDGDAKQAVAVWKENPRTLNELYRITGSECAVRFDGSVECPRNAGISYRARFKKTGVDWRMVSFVEGD
jgi:hypothetical protein